MSLIKHQTNELILKTSPEMLVNILDETITVYHDCKKIHQSLKDFIENGGDEFDLMDEIEPYVGFSVDNLNRFKTFKCSATMTVNKYLDRVFSDLTRLNDNLKDARCASFYISEKEMQTLCKQSYKVVAGMIFFVLVEFNVFDMVQDNNQLNTTDVDEILSIYCKRTRITVDNLVEELLKDSHDYSLTFDIFDSYPELEIKFMEIMGPSIVGVDEAALNLDLVTAVVDGKLSPEDLIALINQNADTVEE